DAIAPVVSSSAASAPSWTAPSPSALSSRNGMRTVAVPSAISSITIPRRAMKGTDTRPRASGGTSAAARAGRSGARASCRACPPGVRVLVLVRDADADAVCRSRLHAKAEPAVVRHVLEARRERADPFGHLTIRLDRHAAGGRDLYDARPGDAIEPAARDAASPLMR